MRARGVLLVRVFKRIAAVLVLSGVAACASDGLGALGARPEFALGSLFQSKSTPPDFILRPLRGRPAKPPSGYIGFCQRFPDQCTAPADAPRQVHMTETLRHTLEGVNIAFNQAFVAEDDITHYGKEEYWNIPTDGYGDCEDYVLAKRQVLIHLGLPEPALRIAVVLTPSFVRHAVLTVVTDEGNFVLDNLHDEIVAWDKTDYLFLERQDPASVTGWVSLR
jgi:predicted transglutaminase-like cysteine proteinase